MKITINQNPNIGETEVTINCRQLDSELEEILSQLSLIDNTVTGVRNGEVFFVALREVLYFESVDNKTFFYTESETFECKTRLYQLEEKLQNTMFARISKSTIANLKKLKSIRRGAHSRLEASLINGEKLLVSRQYVESIRTKLGV